MSELSAKASINDYLHSGDRDAAIQASNRALMDLITYDPKHHAFWMKEAPTAQNAINELRTNPNLDAAAREADLKKLDAFQDAEAAISGPLQTEFWNHIMSKAKADDACKLVPHMMQKDGKNTNIIQDMSLEGEHCLSKPLPKN